MVVIIMENVPESLRGELTRWMLEAKAGVFVGTISAAVRDRLWVKVCKGAKGGGVLLIYSSNTEQGFVMESYGDPRRNVIDLEGIFLVKVR